jgi:hypothetical protein
MGYRSEKSFSGKPNFPAKQESDPVTQEKVDYCANNHWKEIGKDIMLLALDAFAYDRVIRYFFIK